MSQLIAEDCISLPSSDYLFNFRLIGDRWIVRQPTMVCLEMSSSLEDLQHSPLWFATCYKAWLVLNRPDRIHNIHLTNFFTFSLTLINHRDGLKCLQVTSKYPLTESSKASNLPLIYVLQNIKIIPNILYKLSCPKPIA